MGSENEAPIPRVANLVTGGIVLAGVLALAGWGAWRAWKEVPAAEPRTLVAYFEESGGLKKGDYVIVNGRRSGDVLSTEVVQSDGRTLVRVVFEIKAERLRDGVIPADSTVGVRQPTGFGGRPALVLSYGKDKDTNLEVGAEVGKVRQAGSADPFAAYGEQIREFNERFETQLEALTSEAAISAMKAQAADIRKLLADWDGRVDAVQPALKEFDQNMQGALDGLAGALKTLSERGPELDRQLADIAGQTRDGSDRLAEVGRNLDDLRKNLRALIDATRGGRDATEPGFWGRLFRQGRAMATQVAAGSHAGEYSPQQFGGMPPWRKNRPYYNGGKYALEGADRVEREAGEQKVKHNTEVPVVPRPEED